MSAFTLLKAEVRPLTPDLAKQIRDTEPSSVERDFDEKRVAYLREKVEQGLFLPPQWSLVQVGEKTQRINGQHSSTMLAGLDGKFPHGLQAHIDTYQARTPEDVTLLFRQIDNRKSSRSPADISGAYQGNVPELREVPKDVAKKAAEAICWHQFTVDKIPTAYKGDDRYSVLMEPENHPFILWLSSLFNVKTDEMTPTAVVAAIFSTFTKNAPAAKLFWEKVARMGEITDDQDPTTVLDLWLREPKENKDIHRPAGESYNGCIYAWNMHRAGKAVNAIKSSVKRGFYATAE